MHTHTPTHPHNVKENTVYPARPPRCIALLSSSDAHIPVVEVSVKVDRGQHGHSVFSALCSDNSINYISNLCYSWSFYGIGPDSLAFTPYARQCVLGVHGPVLVSVVLLPWTTLCKPGTPYQTCCYGYALIQSLSQSVSQILRFAHFPSSCTLTLSTHCSLGA